jgi:hypothetical protein
LPFAYYARLSKPDQATYRASDAVPALRLTDPAALRPDVDALRAALVRDDAAEVARFFKRESSVFRQLVPEASGRPRSS